MDSNITKAVIKAATAIRISFSYTIRAFPTGKVFTFPEEAVL